MQTATENTYTRISFQSHVLIVSKTVKVPTAFKTNGRTQIEKFSKSSAHRMGRFLRNCTANYINMVTLTYPEGYPEDGKVFKEHLRRFIQECKRESSRTYTANSDTHGVKFSIFWIMEFQRRGAAHFHLFTTHDYDKSWIAKTWYRICNTEDSRHLRAGTRIEKLRSGRRGTCSYAAKYAAKSDQKDIPNWVKNAGRFWGVSGERLAVAADILLSAKVQKEPAVNGRLQLLSSLMKDAIRQKEITLTRKGSTYIYYLKNDVIVSKVAAMLARIELSTNIYSDMASYFELPHHWGDHECL